MRSIQYFLLVILISTGHLFVLLDLPSDTDLLKYNGDQPAVRSTNSYYSPVNSSSSSLVDYMKTLYEHEKLGQLPNDYNLIRAVAPRLGKIVDQFNPNVYVCVKED